MSHCYLGTIGFSYKDWLGEFYPIGTTQREYLPYYCKVFNSVELDTTFHSIPQQAKVQSWYTTSPLEFKFCIKTPRIITHELKLKGAQGLVIEFIESLSPLRGKLGPILIQLPPSYTQENYSVLDEFLEILPRSHRYAIEFRHSSWYNVKTTQLLNRHQVCWVTLDYPNLPKQIILTTDFLYFRWIGINGMYHHHTHEQVDKTPQLRSWVQAIDPFLEKVPMIYGFFNNDYAGFAAGTCKRFMLLAGLTTDEQNIPYQERLF
jgi:uncharacterized protein YecE (DUF72 family)